MSSDEETDSSDEKDVSLEECYSINGLSETAANHAKIKITLDEWITSQHFWNPKCSNKFIVIAAYTKNETMNDIFDAIKRYIELKSNIININNGYDLDLQINSISKQSFLKPDLELNWWNEEEQWSDYISKISNDCLMNYDKQDIIKYGLQLDINEKTIELYTDLAKLKQIKIKKVEKEYEEIENNKPKTEHNSEIGRIAWRNYYMSVEMTSKRLNILEEALLKIKVNVSGESKQVNFNSKFIVYVDYSEKELISNIFDLVTNYLENAHYPVKLEVNGQHCNGFASNTQASGVYAKDFESYVKQLKKVPITRFEKDDIEEEGLRFNVMPQVYLNKKLESTDYLTCKHLKNMKSDEIDVMKCPIYYAMKVYYKFCDFNLQHMQNYSHYLNEYEEKIVCKYGDQCKAYIRCENGVNRMDDQCHMQIYRHPPRNRRIELSQNLHSFVYHDNSKFKENESKDQSNLLYYPTKEDRTKYKYNETDGFLDALLNEVIANGFKYDLCLLCDSVNSCKHDIYSDNSDSSILKIVNEKLTHDRHRAMNSPLNRAEMLALLLYTGCDCNYDLCASQRKYNFNKWKWYDYCLYRAIAKISSVESGRFMVYSGIQGVKLNKKWVESGSFTTYVSSSWQKDVAIGFMGGVGGGNEGMMIEIDEIFKFGKSTYHCTCPIYCCDVSWISKFPDECEILFARSVGDDDKLFMLRVVDELNGIQTVRLERKETFEGWKHDGSVWM